MHFRTYTADETPAMSAPGAESHTDLCRITPGLTFLFVEITVDVPLHLCVAAVSHPGQMLAGDRRTRLVVEGSENKFACLDLSKGNLSSKIHFTQNCSIQAFKRMLMP